MLPDGSSRCGGFCFEWISTYYYTRFEIGTVDMNGVNLVLLGVLVPQESLQPQQVQSVTKTQTVTPPPDVEEPAEPIAPLI